MKYHIKYATHKSALPEDNDTFLKKKIYLRLATEMHEKFPECSINECYKMIRDRHLFNRHSIKMEKENYLKKKMEQEKNA